MSNQFALDLGTTNTVVAVAEEGSVRVLHLRGLAREQPTQQSPLIPSAIHFSHRWERWLGLFPHLRLRAAIGQEALSYNIDGQSPAFTQGFKRYLDTQPHRPVARIGIRQVSVRAAVGMFLKELLTAIRRQLRVRISDLTIPAPVGFYEPYRAELRAIVNQLGVRRFRSVDEPIAAALGYGVNVAREENLLVVDFGGGSLNLAVVRLGPRTAQIGAAPVLAKHMVALGGDDVDRWLMEHFVPAKLLDVPEWRHDVRWEAMRVKEQVSQEGHGEFRWSGLRKTMSRDELVGLLTKHELYDQLRNALTEIHRQLTQEPSPITMTNHQSPIAHSPAVVDEVLLVGGSTLLPEVAAVVDDAFQRAIVRHDPTFVFTAVALGAARFAGGVPVDDFIYHDYALAVQDERTHTVEYELLIPRRTRYPTPPDFAVRYYADFPGMSEMRFSVCEVGRLGQAPVSWQWRPNGNFYWAPRNEQERALVVELNPADTPLPLRPAGRGTSPRLRVTYSVNAERWLCATVHDLLRKVDLKVQEQVVRLR